MRRWLAPIAILVIGAAGAFWYNQQLARTRSGFPAPDFVLQDLQGREQRLSQLRGNVVLLNVWATWCLPCREEMPSMEILQRRLANEGFVVLAVSQDEAGRGAVQPYVEELGLTFRVLLDPAGEVARKFGVTGYPETFLIDRSGTVVLHHIGFQNWADQRVEAMLRQLLRAPSPQA